MCPQATASPGAAEVPPPAENPWLRRRASLRAASGGREWPLSSVPFTVGSAVSCDLGLPSGAALQACVAWLEGHHVLFDCARASVLLVNGQSLGAPHVLLPGDTLVLGGTLALTYELEAGGAEAPEGSGDHARGAIQAAIARGTFGLRATAGPLAGPDFLFFRPLVILGSSESCSLRMTDPSTAPEHAVFVLYGQGAVVYPKSGEVLVNGQPTHGPVPLSPGDRVGLPSGQQLELFRADGRGPVEVRPEDAVEVGSRDSRMSCTLLFEQGERRGLRFAARQRSITLGRAHDCDIPLASPDVSVEHARLQAEDDVWWLIANGLNPTLLNGSPVAGGVELVDGDRVELPGNNTFSFQVEGQQPGKAGTPGARRTLASDAIARRFGVERPVAWAVRKIRGPWAGPPGDVVAYFDSSVVKIGRGESCDLVLNDRGISRVQLIVRSEGGKLIAEDQGLVPCRLDGDALERKRELTNGVKLSIGRDIELSVALGLRKPEAPRPENAAAGGVKVEKKSDLWIYAGVGSLMTTLFFLWMAFFDDDAGFRRAAALSTMPERELAWLAAESFGDEFFTPAAMEETVTLKRHLRFTRDERELLRARRTARPLGPPGARTVEALKLLAGELFRSAAVRPEGYRQAFRALHEALARSSRSERPGLQRMFDNAAEGYVELLASHFFRALISVKQRDYDGGRAEYRQILQLIGEDTNPGYKATGFRLLELERAAGAGKAEES